MRSSCGDWVGQSCFHDEVLRKLYGQSYYINKPLGNANNHAVLSLSLSLSLYIYIYIHICEMDSSKAKAKKDLWSKKCVALVLPIQSQG